MSLSSRSVRRAVAALIVALSTVAHSSVTSAQTVYAVVWGHPQFVVGSSTLHSGLFRSTDAGRTWTHLGPENLKAYAMDVVDSSRGRILFIAAGNGVHRSLDSGRTWKIVTDWRVTEVLDVIVDQRDWRRIHIATAYGYWRSNDGGETWQNPSGAIQKVFVRSLSDSSSLTATTEASWADPRALSSYASTDAGSTWTSIGTRTRPTPAAVDSFPIYDRVAFGSSEIVATWGNGVYRRDADRLIQSGLEGSQVWSLEFTNY